MLVPPYVWALTIAAIVGLLAYDFFFHVRKPHEPTLAEAARWSALYVGIAVAFGVGRVDSHLDARHRPAHAARA